LHQRNKFFIKVTYNISLLALANLNAMDDLGMFIGVMLVAFFVSSNKGIKFYWPLLNLAN
jgi:hypothetical protein